MPIRPHLWAIACVLFIGGVTLAGSESEPLLLTVTRSGALNVVFCIKNMTTNSVRLPSDGYAWSGYYLQANTTNPAYAVVERPLAFSDLGLTYNWRYVGEKWWRASREEWREHLRIRTLRPGDTLQLTQRCLWSSVLETNIFRFSVPEDWARDYGLLPCSLSVTGFTEQPAK